MKIKLHMIICLIYLLIISILAATITLSQYTSSVSGSDSVTSASVYLSSSEITFTADGLYPGSTKEFSFNVNNYIENGKSDVAQDYSISVSTTGNIPLNFALKCTSETNGTGINKNQAVSGSTWSGGKLAGERTDSKHDYILIASWDSNDNNSAFSDEIDLITVTVNATQSDVEMSKTHDF